MKIIFLDIDGVLNSLSFYEKSGSDDGQLDPSSIALLKHIVDTTDAKIVLSSSWRHGWSPNPEENWEEGKLLNLALGNFGMTIFDKTGKASVKLVDTRCAEILNWLKAAPEPVDSFVILDDADYAWEKYGLAPFLVQTDFRRGGLKACHVEKAISILQKPPIPVKKLIRKYNFHLLKKFISIFS